MIDPQDVWADFQAIKQFSPLIHNITNFVVMDFTANGLLAIGASPIMAHAKEEAAEVAAMAASLVLNMGTLSADWVEGMLIARKAANSNGIPVIFDPVGAGATLYRKKTAHTILSQGKIKTIRANASEVTSLAGRSSPSKGVDSLLHARDCLEQAKTLASLYDCVVWMSGETDVITNGQASLFVHNGHLLMSKVTGMGCLATAIAGAFLAVNSNPFLGSVHAALCMGIAGEIAALECKGPASFKLAMLDALYALSLDHIKERMKVNETLD